MRTFCHIHENSPIGVWGVYSLKPLTPGTDAVVLLQRPR